MSRAALVTSALVASGACVGTAGGAVAQASLDARRDAVFEQMFRAPTDLDLMLSYARLSVQMRDYEQVVATLERVVDKRPELLEARLELAIAYYALGAYDIAVYHFNIVRGAPGLPPDVVAEIERYTATATTRVSNSSLTGYVEAGPAYGFVDGGTGIELGFGLTWRYRFDGATQRSWITELRGQTLHFPDTDEETVSYFLLRTGPEFSLDGDAFGARLRPYLALRSSVDFDLDDRSTLGVGAQLTDNFGTDWAGFALIEGGALRRTDLSETVDGSFVSGQIGATYFPGRNMLMRLSLRTRRDDTDNDRTDVFTYGARLDLRYSFLPGWAASDRKWLLTGYGLVDWQNFTSVTPEREDRIAGLGLALRGYVRDDYYLEARGDRLERDSNIAGGDGQREVVSLVFGRDF